MPRVLRLAAAAALLTAAGGHVASTMPAAGQPAAEQGLLCRQAIQAAEAGSGMPANMLVGIARVESGRRDAVTGRFHPWPWTINAEGRGFFFDSKAEAVAFARQLQGRGVRSFDVGCMQVNMMHHGSAFQSLEEAFDPGANARYAVRFMGQLKEKSGSWETASAWYHSANPEYGAPYRAMVVTAMAVEAKNPGDYTMLASAGAAGTPTGGGVGSGLQSMPRGLGTVAYLAHGGGGRIIPLAYVSYPSFANGGIAAVPQDMPPPRLGGGMGMGGIGRGLDAYRAQPIAVVGPRPPTLVR
jgi:hypothetical protein